MPIVSSSNLTSLYTGDNAPAVVPSVAYGNANVVGLLAVGTDGANTIGNITATGNISGDYFIGNGSLLTGIQTGYGNANVEALLAGGITSNVITTANISGSYILGNGSQLTGLPATYSNAQVATFLANFGSNTISTTGNITGGNFIGSGAALTSITGANVTGTVANATHATVADSANAVAGGNVTGNVANAVHAYFADVANSVSGANVSGTVANATYATSAGTAVTVTGNAQPNITSVGALTSLTVSGNATIAGDLTVSGNTYVANVSTLEVQDPIIGLGRGPNNTPLTTNDGKDRGVDLWYYTTSEQQAFMGYDNSAGKMILANNVSIANEVVTVNSYGTTTVGTLEATAVSATGNVNSGNVIIPNGGKIIGDFSTAVAAGRTVFQTSVANGGTNLVALPNGTSNIATIVTYNNSDGGNAAVAGITIGATAAQLRVIRNGTGSFLPFTIDVGGANRAYFDTNGNVGIANSAPLHTLAVTGNAYISANVTGGNLLTGGLISATGNITSAAYFIGDGSKLSNITAANITGAYGNANVANFLANFGSNTIVTTGNISGGNISTTGNVTASNVSISGNFTAGNLTATGNLTGANIVGTTLITAPQIVTTGGSGNISNVNYVLANYFVGDGSLLTNLPAGSYGNANVVSLLASFGSNTITTTGNITGGNLLTSGVASAAGNVHGANFNTAGLVSATGNVIGGNITTVGQVSATGNIQTAASIVVPSNNRYYGAFSLGATAGRTYFQTSNVSAVAPTYLSAIPGPGHTAGGSNLGSAINVFSSNDIGNSSAAGLYSYSNETRIWSLGLGTGNANPITFKFGLSANAGATLDTSGNFTAVGNVIGGNITTAGQVSATGNVQGAYIKGDGSLLTNLPASSYGNANVTSLLASFGSNTIVTTGNITGGNIIGIGSSLTGINAFGNVAVSGQTTVSADNTTDTLTLVAGTNITITTDAANNKVTITSTATGGGDTISPLMLMGG